MRSDLANDDPVIRKILGTNDRSERIAALVQTELSGRLVGSLNAHASALKDAADASDKYAGRLVWATWALVLASVVLIIVTWLKT